MRSALFWFFVVAVLGVGLAIRADVIRIPDAWNPWAPLRIEEPLNWLTRYKLARATAEPALCLATLEHANVRYEAVPDRNLEGECGLHNAVRIDATSIAVGQPFTLSCRSAVALALWEEQVLQPAARAHYTRSVKRLEHLGSYACRNIYGRKGAPLSRHATADALDIAGFVLEDGRRVRVEREWGSDDEDGRFLREVRDGACRVFDGVLSPDYNAAHRDHFHLERGGYRVCR